MRTLRDGDYKDYWRERPGGHPIFGQDFPNTMVLIPTVFDKLFPGMGQVIRIEYLMNWAEAEYMLGMVRLYDARNTWIHFRDGHVNIRGNHGWFQPWELGEYMGEATVNRLEARFHGVIEHYIVNRTLPSGATFSYDPVFQPPRSTHRVKPQEPISWDSSNKEVFEWNGQQ